MCVCCVRALVCKLILDPNGIMTVGEGVGGQQFKIPRQELIRVFSSSLRVFVSFSVRTDAKRILLCMFAAGILPITRSSPRGFPPQVEITKLSSTNE